MSYFVENYSFECQKEENAYSSPRILRPLIQPEKYGLKLKMVLK